MSLLLADEAVCGEAELGDARVPDVLHQSPDIVGFRDVVRRAADRQDGDTQTLSHGSILPVSTGSSITEAEAREGGCSSVVRAFECRSRCLRFEFWGNFALDKSVC